jgi:acetyl-CoA C-acetyltransferase
MSVILAACRTPIGKFQGALASMPATNLGAAAIRAAMKRAELPPDTVDEVIMGEVLPAGVGQAPARQAALGAGIPSKVAALTINKVCGSGLKAVMLADQAIRGHDASVIVAGGMENMSQAPWLIERQLKGLGNHQLVDSMIQDGLRCSISELSMGEIAERLATRQKITREDQDAFACDSHRKAVAATRDDIFKDELIPLPANSKPDAAMLTADEGPRPDCALDRLARLRPSFIADGTVTAGNSAMISDGAAAVVVASSEFAQSHRLNPLAEIVSSATAGLDPEDLFIAPVEAVRKLLKKTGHLVGDIDLWEINEAFAVQMVACQRMLDISSDRLNVAGGAIALGHPIGASGARVLTTLVHALRREDRELGIASLCLGGGNAVAMLIRRLS